MSKLNVNSIWKHTQEIVSGAAAETVVDLPRQLEAIRKDGLWKERRKFNGKRYKSMAEALIDHQPAGLGFGQYNGRLRPFQLETICVGFPELVKVIRQAQGKSVQLAAHGVRGKAKKRVDNIKSNQGGTSAEYRLGRLVRDSGDDSKVTPERKKMVQKALRDYEAGKVSLSQAFRAAYKTTLAGKEHSDRNSNPVLRVRMYWNRASRAERKQIAAMIEDAGLRKIK